MALEVVTAAAVPVPVAPPKLALIPAPMFRAVVLVLPTLSAGFLPSRSIAIGLSILAVLSDSSVLLPTLLVIPIPICSFVSSKLPAVLCPKSVGFFPMIVFLSVLGLPMFSFVVLPISFFPLIHPSMVVDHSAMSVPFVILEVLVQTVLLLVLDLMLLCSW